MFHSYDEKHEREYLAELMQSFPVYPQLSLDEADEQIKDFWNNLASAEEFAEALKELSDQAVYAFFQKIPKELHK